jgi:hypothetical protein
MPKLLNLCNQRFARLLALALHPDRAKNGAARWVCECDCGRETVVKADDLVQGKTQSCGCYRSDLGKLNSRLFRETEHSRYLPGPRRALQSLHLSR